MAYPSPQLIEPAIQSVVDALSIALDRPILLDDATLAPLAYSRQWGVDTVRSESILGRGASPEVRRALLAQGIERAEDDVMRTVAAPDLGMAERLCLPVRFESHVLGYVWLLEPGDVTPSDLDQLRAAVCDIALLLATAGEPIVSDESRLIEALRSPTLVRRQQAVVDARTRGLLTEDAVVLCLLAPQEPGAEAVAAGRRLARRVSVGHAFAGTAPEGAAVILSLTDPALRTLEESDVATWAHSSAGPGVAVGLSGRTAPSTLHIASHEAGLALRIARAKPSADASVAWSALSADRLVAQLPPSALADIPDALAGLLQEEPVLVETLAAFLERAGNVQTTAAALSLHRSGLYYRLRRIEDLTGLDLDRGDDRLLAHLSIRTTRLSQEPGEASTEVVSRLHVRPSSGAPANGSGSA